MNQSSLHEKELLQPGKIEKILGKNGAQTKATCPVVSTAPRTEPGRRRRDGNEREVRSVCVTAELSSTCSAWINKTVRINKKVDLTGAHGSDRLGVDG